MIRIQFIINPKSGTNRQKITPEDIDRILSKDQFDVSIKYTEYAGHATELAEQAVKDKFEIVVACGGDGSVNEVAKGLQNSKSALGIIPLGSGNGFARYLEIPMNLDGALAVFTNYKKIKSDAGLANGHFFVNVAGMGFDADVAGHFATTKLRGIVSYMYSALKIFSNYRSTHYEVYLDGEKLFSRKSFFVTVANGAQFGNDFVLAPNARIDDAKLNLVILYRFWKPLAAFIIFLTKFNIAQETRFSDILKGRKFRVIAKDPRFMQIDGEPIGEQTEMVVEVLPAVLEVIVPNKRLKWEKKKRTKTKNKTGKKG